MSRLTAVSLAAVLALSASAADAPKKAPAASQSAKPGLSRTSGKILQAQSKLAPGANGPVFREGRLTIFDKAEHTEEFKVTAKTKVTLDGKPAKFQNSSSVGTLVLKALYDPSTKELASVDLKSVPKTDADDTKFGGTMTGEVANTDVVKGVISVRSAKKAVRDYAVTDATKIRREAEGTPGADIAFEAVQVGEAVEVHSLDGTTASEIHVRAAK